VKYSILCATAMAALLNAVSVQASDLNNPKKTVVHYGDLDTNHSAGAQMLLSRIDDAASQVCKMDVFSRDLNARQVFMNCKDSSEQRAVASLPFNLMARIDNAKDTEVVAAR